MSDTDAISATLDGNYQMFEALLRRYNQRLFRIGMSYLKSRMDVEDAMQEVYIKAFQKLDSYNAKSSIATWMTRIMINECLMRLRKNARTKRESGERVSLEVLDRVWRTGPEKDLSPGEIKAALETAISRLPRSYRTVYLMREVQELPTAEVAASLEISPQNVKVRLHRARETLKSFLLEAAEEMELFSYPAPYCNPFSEKVMNAIKALATDTN